MRISDRSSDVCSSDLAPSPGGRRTKKAGNAGPFFILRTDDQPARVSRRPASAPCPLLRFGPAWPGAPLRAPGLPCARRAGLPGDRKSVVWGKSVSVRVDLGGRRTIKNKNKALTLQTQ